MHRSRRAVSSQLARVRSRFETWRERIGGRGSRGKPIPEELWSAAAEVARAEGICATARVLRLNSARLTERMTTAASRGAPETDFVAFDVGELQQGSKHVHAVLRFVGRDGERLRIDVAEASAQDLVSIARAFWSRES